jgi:hypothetical protein
LDDIVDGPRLIRPAVLVSRRKTLVEEQTRRCAPPGPPNAAFATGSGVRTRAIIAPPGL